MVEQVSDCETPEGAELMTREWGDESVVFYDNGDTDSWIQADESDAVVNLSDFE